MEIIQASREGNDDAIIGFPKSAYDTKHDPDKLLMRAAHHERQKVLEACLGAGIQPDLVLYAAWLNL